MTSNGQSDCSIPDQGPILLTSCQSSSSEKKSASKTNKDQGRKGSSSSDSEGYVSVLLGMACSVTQPCTLTVTLLDMRFLATSEACNPRTTQYDVLFFID